MSDGTTSTPHEVREIVVQGSAIGLAQTIEVAGVHELVGDEPVSGGGADSGPGPYDFLLTALGCCTSMTVSLYARRKQWPLESVRVTLRHAKVNASELEGIRTREGLVDRIERDVQLFGSLDAEQRARLMQIADKCPVHKTLTSEIVIRTALL
ncbi:MAG: OsmC family protein [Vicinamibacteria bacterium]